MTNYIRIIIVYFQEQVVLCQNNFERAIVYKLAYDCLHQNSDTEEADEAKEIFIKMWMCRIHNCLEKKVCSKYIYLLFIILNFHFLLLNTWRKCFRNCYYLKTAHSDIFILTFSHLSYTYLVALFI